MGVSEDFDALDGLGDFGEVEENDAQSSVQTGEEGEEEASDRDSMSDEGEAAVETQSIEAERPRDEAGEKPLREAVKNPALVKSSAGQPARPSSAGQPAREAVELPAKVQQEVGAPIKRELGALIKKEQTSTQAASSSQMDVGTRSSMKQEVKKEANIKKEMHTPAGDPRFCVACFAELLIAGNWCMKCICLHRVCYKKVYTQLSLERNLKEAPQNRQQFLVRRIAYDSLKMEGERKVEMPMVLNRAKLITFIVQQACDEFGEDRARIDYDVHTLWMHVYIYIYVYLREFVQNYRHLGPRRVWKVESQPHALTPDPGDPRDPQITVKMMEAENQSAI